MARAPHTIGAIRIALIWCFALILVPFGPGMVEAASLNASCEDDCRCDDDDEADADAPLLSLEGSPESDETGVDPCDQDCDEGCSGCDDSSLPVGLEPPARLAPSRAHAVVLRPLTPDDAPTSGAASGVFRPPRRAS